MALAEAKKLNGVVITESPGFTPAATSASQSASVPDAQPTAQRCARERCDLTFKGFDLRTKNKALRIANARDRREHLLANAFVLTPQVKQRHWLRHAGLR